MYRIKLDATSAEPELAASNPGDVLAWLTDADFQIRGSAVSTSSTSALVHWTLPMPFVAADVCVMSVLHPDQQRHDRMQAMNPADGSTTLRTRETVDRCACVSLPKVTTPAGLW